jgi:hypothetical protein
MNYGNTIWNFLAVVSILLIFAAFQPAQAETLLFSDEFTGTSIDNSKWVIPGIVGAVGEPTQSGGYLHLDTVGAMWDLGEELPAQKTDFTDVTIYAGIKLTDITRNLTGTDQANVGIRIREEADATAYCFEIWTVESNNPVSKIKAREAQTWTLLGEQNCASALTAGQTVHMTIIASGSSFTFKLGTSKDAQDLALVTFSDSTHTVGRMRLALWNMKAADIDYIEVRDGTNALIFSDEFTGDTIDDTIWAVPGLAYAQDTPTLSAGFLNLSADLGNPSADQTVSLGSRFTAGNFEARAKLKLTDPASHPATQEANTSLYLRGGLADGSGHWGYGLTFGTAYGDATPTNIRLRYGGGDFTTLAGPVSVTFTSGQELYVTLYVYGSLIVANVGSTEGGNDIASLSASNSDFTEGWFRLGQWQTRTVEWDYIRVYSYTPMAVDSADWNLYE